MAIVKFITKFYVIRVNQWLQRMIHTYLLKDKVNQITIHRLLFVIKIAKFTNFYHYVPEDCKAFPSSPLNRSADFTYIIGISKTKFLELTK